MSDNNNAEFIEFYGETAFLMLLKFLNNNKLYTGLKDENFEITKVQYREDMTVDIKVNLNMTCSLYNLNDTIVDLLVERIYLKTKDDEYIQWHIRND